MLVRLDNLQPWRGEVVNDLRHPYNIETLWTDAELMAAGLGRAIPFVVPAGKQISGPAKYVRRQNGVIAEVYPTTDAVVGPTISPRERFEQATGLTVDELKALL